MSTDKSDAVLGKNVQGQGRSNVNWWGSKDTRVVLIDKDKAHHDGPRDAS